MKFFVCASLALGLAAALHAGQEWVVIGVVGKWQKVDPNTSATDIVFGTQVTEKTQLKRVGDTSSGSVTVLINNKPVTYACDDPNTLPDPHDGCGKSVNLKGADKGAAKQPGMLTAIATGVVNLLIGQPTRYYSPVSRDYGSLQDAVVQKTGSSVDLKPALASASKGDYRFTFEKLERGKPAAPLPSAPATLHWDPDSNQPAAGPDLQPGLYSLQVETVDHEPAGEAWILVADPQDYARKSAAFDEITKTTAAWKSDVPAAGIRAVNRAALDELSR